jgi:peptidoglycan/xylan/chitin deacetylase (PgdA/CDA1 family)
MAICLEPNPSFGALQTTARAFRRGWAGLALVLPMALAACNPARGVPILLWHSVGEGSPDDYDVSAQEFDAELGLLEEYGATAITLDRLFDARAGRAALPSRAVVLTFDDGRASLLSGATPLLLKHHRVGELFLISERVAADEAHRFVEKGEKAEHPFLIWPEVSAMVDSGAWRIESHSATHRAMAKLSDEEQRWELRESRRVLKEATGQPINFFAYPGGGFNSASRDLAEQEGYLGAMSVYKGPGTRYGMLRTSVHAGGLGGVRQALEAAFGRPEKR